MNTLILTLMFNAASQHFELPPNLLEALCYVESHHDVTAIHKDDGSSDSLGICQIKFETAQWLGFIGTREQLMQPKINIYFAAKFLSYQKMRYAGNITKAVVAYNRGNAKNVKRSEYSDRVERRWSSLGRAPRSIATTNQ